jgi:hypothetical protein
MNQLGADRHRIGGRTTPLPEVRAAQLRGQVVRWAIGKVAFGTLFLIGALSYTVTPELQPGSALMMAMLVVLSSLHIGLGLRALSRVRQFAARFWLPATLAWGLLATVMLRILTDR